MKDQMTAQNIVLSNDNPATYPGVDFLPMYTGMWALLPASDIIANATAANNKAHKTDVEEAVVDVIKDCVKKLQDTKTGANGVLANPGLAPAQETLDPTLLHPGAHVPWGSATVLPNPGHLPQNPPLAIMPGAPQPQAQQVNLAPPPQVVVAPEGNSGASASVLPQAVNNAWLAPVVQAQLGNDGASGNILPQPIVNPLLAPVIQAQ